MTIRYHVYPQMDLSHELTPDEVKELEQRVMEANWHLLELVLRKYVIIPGPGNGRMI